MISEEDIIWYYRNSHEIELTGEGTRKIQALKVGVYGEPFVMKLGDEEIYNGSFWSPISSVPYAGIAIETYLYSNDSVINWRKAILRVLFKASIPEAILGDFDHFQRIGKLKE